MELKWFRCFFGIHQREIYKELECKNSRGEITGITIVSRCIICGKVSSKYIPTSDRL